MTVKWNSAVDHVPLFSRIQSVIESGGQNNSNALFDYQSCIAIFVNSLDFDENVRGEFTIDDKEALVWAAVRDVRKNGKFTKERLVNAVARRVREYISIKKEKYSVVTTLNLDVGSIKKVTYRGVTIHFSSKLSSKYQKARDILMTSDRVLYESYEDTKKMYARAVLLARGPSDAMRVALSRIDMLRGIWDIYQAPLIQMGSPYNKSPIHTVEKGPVHSVHMPGGEIATDTFWFELYPNPHEFPVKLTENTLNKQQYAIDQLRKMKYRNDLQDVLERSAIALSNSNFEYAFMQLWAVLEKLCCSSGLESKITVKRASYIFEDRNEKRAILNHLRLLRNNLAHYRAGDRDLRIHVFQLYYFVRSLIKFNIDQAGKFETLKSMCSVLDLPDDKESLEYNIRKNKIAMQWRKYKSKNDERPI